MASAETRSDRLVVLVSPSEKKRLAEQARRANMSLGEFVRAATDDYAGEPALDPALLAELTAQVKEAADRARSALDALEVEAKRIRGFDEEAYREAVRREYGASAAKALS